MTRESERKKFEKRMGRPAGTAKPPPPPKRGQRTREHARQIQENQGNQKKGSSEASSEGIRGAGIVLAVGAGLSWLGVSRATLGVLLVVGSILAVIGTLVWIAKVYKNEQTA